MHRLISGAGAGAGEFAIINLLGRDAGNHRRVNVVLLLPITMNRPPIASGQRSSREPAKALGICARSLSRTSRDWWSRTGFPNWSSRGRNDPGTATARLVLPDSRAAGSVCSATPTQAFKS